MKVNILLNQANKSWIFEKIAQKLSFHLKEFDIDAKVSEQEDISADLTHHMSWAFANKKSNLPSTMFITHLDDPFKMRQVKETLNKYVDVGICMSNETVKFLVEDGCLPESLCFISPAHDNMMKPRKIVIGLTTRIYPDGRKREALLLGLMQMVDLTFFEFKIFGEGWDHIVSKMKNAGITVDYYPGTDDFRKDYQTIVDTIPYFDYYLYLGMDEGSLGTLDALAAGVPTIITPQGFHLDLPGGLTHPFVTLEDLANVFSKILNEKQQLIDSVSSLTWRRYAEMHAKLWRSLFKDGSLPTDLNSIRSTTTSFDDKAKEVRVAELRKNALNLRRIISTVSHLPLLSGLRDKIDRLRTKK